MISSTLLSDSGSIFRLAKGSQGSESQVQQYLKSNPYGPASDHFLDTLKDILCGPEKQSTCRNLVKVTESRSSRS